MPEYVAVFIVVATTIGMNLLFSQYAQRKYKITWVTVQYI